ncbi:unnamed protein product, partial [Laminaria digitata]
KACEFVQAQFETEHERAREYLRAHESAFPFEEARNVSHRVCPRASQRSRPTRLDEKAFVPPSPLNRSVLCLERKLGRIVGSPHPCARRVFLIFSILRVQ